MLSEENDRKERLHHLGSVVGSSPASSEREAQEEPGPSGAPPHLDRVIIAP
jgi:hypothetical protein